MSSHDHFGPGLFEVVQKNLEKISDIEKRVIIKGFLLKEWDKDFEPQKYNEMCNYIYEICLQGISNFDDLCKLLEKENQDKQLQVKRQVLVFQIRDRLSSVFDKFMSDDKNIVLSEEDKKSLRFYFQFHDFTKFGKAIQDVIIKKLIKHVVKEDDDIYNEILANLLVKTQFFVDGSIKDKEALRRQQQKFIEDLNSDERYPINLINFAKKMNREELLKLVLGVCPNLVDNESETKETELMQLVQRRKRKDEKDPKSDFVFDDDRDRMMFEFLLLQQDIDVNRRNVQQESALMMSLKKGDFYLAGSLLVANADPELYKTASQKKPAQTPLQKMQLDQNIAAFTFLVKRGADLLVKDEKGRSILINAILLAKRHKTMEFFDVLLGQNAEEIVMGLDNKRNFRRYITTILDEPDNDGKTPLMHALGNPILLNNLLDHKTNINFQDTKENSKKTALMLAIEGGHFESAKALIERGAKIKLRDANGKTALDYAKAKNHDDLIKVILNQSKTSLMKAIEKEDFELAFELLKSDNHLNRRDLSGKTALSYAIEKNHLELIKQIVNKKGFRPKKNLDRMNPLMIAIGQKEIFWALVERFPHDINDRNNQGKTVLALALENDQLDVAKELIKGRKVAGSDRIVKAKVNTVDDFGKTPLMIALERKQFEIAKLILQTFEVEEKVNYKDKQGKSVLDYANESGNQELVKVIEFKIIERRKFMFALHAALHDDTPIELKLPEKPRDKKESYFPSLTQKAGVVPQRSPMLTQFQLHQPNSSGKRIEQDSTSPQKPLPPINPHSNKQKR